MNPILFIHGIGGDKKQYQPIIKYLKKKKLNNFYEFKYESRIGLSPIKVIAKELSEFIDKNIKEENINIISFSQGGIIALAYLKYYKNRNIKKLFTLCSPYYGSRLAYLINFPGFIDLRPNSKLLKELNDYIQKQKQKLEIYSLYTPFDLVVFPGWNAKFKNGKNKMVLAPSHQVVFFWPSTKKFIYKNLF